MFISGFIAGFISATVIIALFIAWVCYVIDRPRDGKFTEYEGE